MMLTPEQDNPDYKLLYQSLMKQKAELVEQHRLLGNHVKQQNSRIAELEKDAARYRYISNGCTVILPDGTECEDQQQLDAAMQPDWPEDTSDYGSRIAVVGQNGNDGLHYGEDKP